MNKITITIDGPAGAGKSTVSKFLAAQIGFVYVDTGALYRGVAYEINESKIDYKDQDKLASLLNEIEFECEMLKDGFKLISNGNDISDKIRTTEISMLASATSALPEVRAALLGIQKDIALKYNAVFEGRDMGSVVFPNAQYKFFLIADLTIRAERRFKEFSETLPGNSDKLDKIEKDMKKRDHDDSTRVESPLKPAHDSIIIDSTNLNVEQVVEKIRSNIEIS